MNTLKKKTKVWSNKKRNGGMQKSIKDRSMGMHEKQRNNENSQNTRYDFKMNI